MEKKFGILVLALLANGCGSAASSGATGDDDDGVNKLSNGAYAYTVDAVPNDTCWAPPKTNPTLPMSVNADIQVDGNIVHVTPDPVGGVAQTFDVTRTGDALSGTNEGDADLNPQGLDCVLHISSTLTGTVTADDTFDATIALTVSEVSGLACGLLVGTLDANQLDQLPCSLTLSGTATLK